jgi:hypothetical protein
MRVWSDIRRARSRKYPNTNLTIKNRNGYASDEPESMTLVPSSATQALINIPSPYEIDS